MTAPLHIEPGWDSPAHVRVLEEEFRRSSEHPHPEVRRLFLDMLNDRMYHQSALYKTLLLAEHGERLTDALRVRLWTILP